MELTPDSKDINKILTNPNLMLRMMELALAKILKQRLGQLTAANSFYDYLKTGLGKPHPLSGKLKRCYGISLTANVRLVVEPVSDSLDVESLKKCTNIIIKGVEDYHGGKSNWIIH